MPSLKLDTHWVIPESDLELRFVHSSGPGGQNVNKLATKAELRFQLASTRALSPSQKERLRKAFPAHHVAGGAFLLTSERYRSQRMNQKDVLERLASMILSVRYPPKRRIATKPSLASKRRRVSEKRQRGELKAGRRRPPGVD